MHMKRPVEELLTQELIDCASALKKVRPSTPVETLEKLIDQGRTHLHALVMAESYPGEHENRIGPLKRRLDQAQDLLDHKLAAV